MDMEIKNYINRIFTGDAYYILKLLPDNIIDCVNTSPPYYKLRNYGNEVYTIWITDKNCKHEWIDPYNYNKGEIYYYRCSKCGSEKFQLGLEPTPELYIEHLATIMDEVKRVLKPTGILFLNIGDNYDKNGNLLLIPFRVALELQKRGWIIRNIINWCKKILYYNNELKKWDIQGTGLPESADNRFTKHDETIIMATKSKKYYFNYSALKLNWAEKSIERFFRGSLSKKYLFQDELNQIQQSPVSNKTTSLLRSIQFTKVKENTTKYLKKIKSKYKNNEKQLALEHSNRRGFNKNTNEYTIKRNLPNPKEFAQWLKNTIKSKNLQKEFFQYFKKSVASHWIRTDDSGFNFPSFGEWLAIKKFLNLQTTPFDEQMESLIIINPQIIKGFKRVPNNWLINPEGSTDYHYAIQPSKIAYLTLIHGCPIYVCSKCGKPYFKNYKIENQEIKEYWGKDCLCNTTEKTSGLVLDPFAGVGTTILIAQKLNYNYIAIEKSPKFSKILKEKLIKNFNIFYNGENL